MMEIKFSPNVRELAQADRKPAKTGDEKDNGRVGIGPEVSALAHARNTAKKELNAAILESTINANAASGSPQALVLKAALEGINDALRATMGDNAIQNTYDSGLDVSPEATAERIVSLSTAFFSSYQEQHTELSQEEALTKFVDLISGGIDTGFSEAREILSGLNVLEGDIATNIDSTYELVQEKLNAFLESFNQAEEVDESS
ncbi:MAG: hypothetical protein GQ547_09785 [Methylophaga sp.]|nr:hypothetical protein [Methylophaga sp.]